MRTALATMALTLLAIPGPGQGTRADYERAAALEGRFRGLVPNAGLSVHWLPGGERFWYRREISKDAYEFILIDAPAAARRQAFDHAALAAALGRAMGGAVAADRLPLEELALSGPGRAARFRAAGRAWEWDQGTGALRELPPRPAATGPGSGRPKRNASAPASRPGRPEGAASPDGRWTAFVRDHNIYLRDRQGAEGPLTRDGTADHAYGGRLFWSPDSARLVALRTRRVEERQVHLVESAPPNQVQPRLHAFAYAKPGDPRPLTLPRLFDPAGRREIPVDHALFPESWSLGEIRWAPDSSRFTFLYNQRGHQLLRVVAVAAADGAARVLVEEKSPTFVDYAHKTFLRHLDGTDELVWMSERDGWCHLYLFDARRGELKNRITRGEWVVRGVDRVDEESRQVWFRAGGIHPGQDPYYVHWCRIGLDGTGLVVLTEGDGTHEVAYSPDRRWLIDTWSRVDQAPVTELRDAATGGLVLELERADLAALAAAGWRPPERFAAKGRDGRTDIYGLIHRPTTFAPGRKYPVIENIYAGPQGFHVPKAFAACRRVQVLAELGFLVVQIDGMGTSGRSKAFHDLCWRNLGDAGFPDRIAWLRAAAARHPELDLTRVGIYGGSAGGQNAMRALIAHGDFYRAAAADCGCHDNQMDKIWWNELWMGYPVGKHYEESSNRAQAHRLQGHLLLTVGELDRNVDPASTMQVVDALIRADKEFELIVVPGAGHGAGETPYAARRRADFFVRHLLGVEPKSRP